MFEHLFQNKIYYCEGKAEFSASLPLSSLSHGSSEIIVICRCSAQEAFLTIIIVKNSCAT